MVESIDPQPLREQIREMLVTSYQATHGGEMPTKERGMPVIYMDVAQLTSLVETREREARIEALHSIRSWADGNLFHIDLPPEPKNADPVVAEVADVGELHSYIDWLVSR